jgi:adenylate cyclase
MRSSAFWNAPLDDPDHHANAARAALAMICKTARAQPYDAGKARAKSGPARSGSGIGLNSGLCCVGNMGSRPRPVVFADRRHGERRLAASRADQAIRRAIVAGSDTWPNGSAGFALLELDRVRVIGRDATESILRARR